MWMAYSEACDTVQPVDLNSAIEMYQRRLGCLELDAEHEGIYGEGRFRIKEECLDLGDKYGEAYIVCEQFLKGMISLERMLLKQEKLNMLSYAMSYFEDFLPEELRNKFSASRKSDSDADVEICVIDGDEGSDGDVIIKHEEAIVTDNENEADDNANSQGYDEVNSSTTQHPVVDDDDPITNGRGYVVEFYENQVLGTEAEIPMDETRASYTWDMLDANDNALNNF